MLPKVRAIYPLNRSLDDTVFLFGIIVLKKYKICQLTEQLPCISFGKCELNTYRILGTMVTEDHERKTSLILKKLTFQRREREIYSFLWFLLQLCHFFFFSLNHLCTQYGARTHSPEIKQLFAPRTEPARRPQLRRYLVSILLTCPVYGLSRPMQCKIQDIGIFVFYFHVYYQQVGDVRHVIGTQFIFVV